MLGEKVQSTCEWGLYFRSDAKKDKLHLVKTGDTRVAKRSAGLPPKCCLLSTRSSVIAVDHRECATEVI